MQAVMIVINKQETLLLSPYMGIYDLVVPKDNMLRQMNELVDFHFILEELESKYCLDNGRNAISPVRMFKYLLLKVMFDLSDVDVVERSKYDMSFKYFLEMAPEDPVMNPSSLTKFRKLRLKDANLLDMLISKTVEIAIEKEVIKSKIIIMDATHTIARYQNQSPKEYLQKASKNVRKTLYQFDESIQEKLPSKPISQGVADELAYCKKLLETVEENPKLAHLPAVKEKTNGLKECIESVQEYRSFSADPEAKIGHKSKEYTFHGYKTHLAMSDERLITAAVITSGEKGDGQYLQELTEKTLETGMEIEAIIGDTAYSSKGNIEYAQEQGIQLISKLHPVITNGHSNRIKGFEFNKDANTCVCPNGHLSIKSLLKKRENDSKRNAQIKYFFDVEKCKICPLKEGCYKESAKTKSYSLTLKSSVHADQEAFQNTEVFKQLARKRYKIEAKNSEIKHRHGYKKAHSSGLFGMEIQGATTIFAVNLKRILKLIQEK